MLHFLASFIKKKRNILTVLGIKMGHITIEVIEILSFVVIQLLSHICLFVAPWTVAYQILRPRLSPGVCSNSCPLNQWCYLTISSSATPFSFCLQSFPASGSFPMSWLFELGGQTIGASASAPVLLMNIQGSFLLGLTGLIFLQSSRLQESFPAPQFESINSSELGLF